MSDGKYFSNMNMLWNGFTSQIVVRNVGELSNNGTHSAVAKDCRRLDPEESEIQAPRVALVMRDTVTSFLRRDCRVSKPLCSSPWSAVHDNTNDNPGWGSVATYMEHNGDNPSYLQWLALKFLDIVNRVEASRGIGRGHDKRGTPFVHKRVVTKLIILSLKIHIHFLRAIVDGRSHRASFTQTTLVPWLKLRQVVVQHVNNSRQRQIHQELAQDSTVVRQDFPINLTQELLQQPFL